MELTTFALAFLLATLVIFVYRRSRASTGSRPLPGPSLFHGLSTFMRAAINNNLHLVVPAWAQQYGDLVQVNILVGHMVFVNNATVYKNLVKSHAFRNVTNDRPPSFFGLHYCSGSRDILFDNFTRQQKQCRNFLITLMKFYGEGVKHFEDIMTRTLKDFTNSLESENNINFPEKLKTYVMQVIGYLLDGDDSAEGKEKIKYLLAYSESVHEMFYFENETILKSFPFVRFIPGLRFKKLCAKTEKSVEELHNAYFYKAKKTFKTGVRRGIIDDMLAKQEELENGNNEFELTDDICKGIVQDLTAGAFLTTFNTMLNLFLQLIKKQEIQERLAQEVSQIIGTATPLFSHKKQMPYTEAVINEALRHLNILPFMVPHAVRDEIVFDGYRIPKNTILMPNSWYVHHREDIWSDPWSFQPERFLDTNGQMIDADHPLRQEMIFFGSGPRACLGEIFARSRMFLILTTLVQRFRFLPPDNGQQLPASDPRQYKLSATIGPDEFLCRLVERKVEN